MKKYTYKLSNLYLSDISENTHNQFQPSRNIRSSWCNKYVLVQIDVNHVFAFHVIHDMFIQELISVVHIRIFGEIHNTSIVLFILVSLSLFTKCSVKRKRKTVHNAFNCFRFKEFKSLQLVSRDKLCLCFFVFKHFFWVVGGY